MAIVTDRTVGIAIGIPPTMITNIFNNVSQLSSPPLQVFGP